MAWRMGLFVCVLALAACVRNPATGERQLNLISESEEIQLGQQAAQEVSQSIGLYDDPRPQAYVEGLGKKLAAISDRPNVPWQFHVVDDASVNAFALPGGPIFVTRGILAHLTSEAELATVVGHEIGHVAARHSVNQLSKAQLAQLGVGIGSILSPDVAKFGQLAGAGLQLLFLKYSRDAENQADELGFRYALKGGYDVRVMKELFTLLEKVSAQQQGRLPEWMATHPKPENRLHDTEKRLEQRQIDFSGLVVNRDTHLAAINGIVFGENPRHGFFRGNSFLHPDLKFRIDFPQGWKAQNQPQAVVAVSPNQDAIASLEIAGQMSPDEAAQKFFSNQAVRAGNISKGNVNGFPAISGSFQAQTDQGVLEGMASFITYAGKTFALLEYTAAGRLSSYESVFRQVLGSFNTLTDPEALNVQPARLEVVKVPRDMTLEQFYAQYPSSIPLDRVALINGVEKGAMLRAGIAVKRVVGGIQTNRMISKSP